MESGTNYRIDEDRVTHEVFEGEVLAVNLDTGIYYSMPGLGGLVWTWIVEGVATSDLARLLSEACLDVPETFESDVRTFVGQLAAGGLIIPSSTAAAVTPTMPAGRRPFKPLKLEVFTDMQDLLLLDPIHETEDAGWPLAKPQD